MTASPGPNTPLRLADAVTYGFPLGGMTVSGLRREIARGRLAVERIAGKQFTTLAAIEEMRELCRQPGKGNVQRSALGPDGLSVAAAAFQAKLRDRQAAERAERMAKRAAQKAARQ